MIRAFLLLITLNLVCISSYFIYNRMDDRMSSSEEIIKREMIAANQEMEKKLKDKILNGGEPDDLIKFRESWLLRLQDIKSLKREKKGIENSLISIVIPLLLSFKFAFIEFFYADEIAVWNGYRIYASHVGWIFLSIAIITIAQAFRSQKSCIDIVKPMELNKVHALGESKFQGLDSAPDRECQTQQELLPEDTVID